MKTTRAFRGLAKGRDNARREAANFAVKSVNKDGSLSRARLDTDMMFVDKAKAEAKAEMMRKLNPGSRFEVVEL